MGGAGRASRQGGDMYGVGLEAGGAAMILKWKGWSSAPQTFGGGRWLCISSCLNHLCCDACVGMKVLN